MAPWTPDLAKMLVEFVTEGEKKPDQWIRVPEWLVLAAAGEIRRLEALAIDIADIPMEDWNRKELVEHLRHSGGATR